jgi:alpha-N-arabinofuranosidase
MLDPWAKLVSCGMNGWNEWDRVVIDGMASLVDYHSLHIYTGSDDYWTNVLQPHQAERAIRCARALIERAAYRQKLTAPPRIAYDEWNVWYRQMTGALEERYTFADALAVGTYLNIFTRNCDWVQMANLAQMVNAIAPIVTSPDAAAVQPIWYPVLLHSQAALDLAVDVHVNGPVVSPDLPAGASRWPFRVGDLGPFGLIDAAATVSGPDVNAHSVAVTLVNRSPPKNKPRCCCAISPLPGPPRSGPSRRPAPATPARCPTWRQRNWKRDRKTRRTGWWPSGCHPGRSPSSRPR